MSIINSKQKSLEELFEVLIKGIDLLANENLDKNLYEAFEKYADSTIKMVDEAYGLAYSESILGIYHFNQQNLINYKSLSIPYSAKSAYNLSNQSSEYRKKLKDLLQKLILLVQKVVCE